MIKLEDKLYTSTEVAQILGVSLRSVYRYIEEDKLTAEVKTATGRHRFTKQNIIDFLYPEGQPEEKESPKEEKTEKKVEEKPEVEEVVEEKTEEVKEPKEEKAEEKVEASEEEPEEEKKPSTKKKEKDEQSEEESVDWLAKFREAAKKFESEAGLAEEGEEKESLTGLAGTVEEEPEEDSISMVYYRSRLGGLKDIAQNIDKNAKSSKVPYAFTLHAGLSLFSPIKPFSMLHTYVRSQDKEFFERILMLTPADEANSQLCLLVSDEADLYKNADELHGLKVVTKDRLLADIKELDQELLKEAEKVLK